MDNRRVTRLERQVRHLRICLVATWAIVGLLVLSGFQPREQKADVLRARGLIIEDSLGRERILIGAPIPAARNRVRTDTARVLQVWGPRFPKSYMGYYKSYRHEVDGMLVLDTSGFDRLAIGQNVPDPNIGKRIGSSTGLVINDSLGFERSGYSVLTVGGKDRVSLGLDIGGREAVMLAADENGRIGLMAADSSHSLYVGRSTPPGANTPFFGVVMQEGSRVRLKVPADSGLPASTR